jgi:hypothetical protein
MAVPLATLTRKGIQDEFDLSRQHSSLTHIQAQAQAQDISALIFAAATQEVKRFVESNQFSR